jgi:hypothetical protein
MGRSAVVAKKFWSSDRLALQATSGSDPLRPLGSIESRRPYVDFRESLKPNEPPGTVDALVSVF